MAKARFSVVLTMFAGGAEFETFCLTILIVLKLSTYFVKVMLSHLGPLGSSALIVAIRHAPMQTAGAV